MIELHLLQDLQGLNVLSSWLALSTVIAEWRRKLAHVQLHQKAKKQSTAPKH